MRIGLFFLVLQSVLLCTTAQAQPGIATDLPPIAAGALEFSPGDQGKPLPQDRDGDVDLQRGTAAAPVFPPAVALAAPTPDVSPPDRQRPANSIRGPPSRA